MQSSHLAETNGANLSEFMIALFCRDMGYVAFTCFCRNMGYVAFTCFCSDMGYVLFWSCLYIENDITFLIRHYFLEMQTLFDIIFESFGH